MKATERQVQAIVERATPEALREITAVFAQPASRSFESLERSGFFPPGFNCKRFIETPASFVAIGDGVAYKLYRGNGRGPELAADDAWVRTRQDLRWNARRIKDLYLGVRVFRTVAGKAEWFSQSAQITALPAHRPRHVLGVAIAMRPIRDARSVAMRLATSPHATDLSRTIANALVALHSSQRLPIRRKDEKRRFEEQLRRRLIAPLSAAGGRAHDESSEITLHRLPGMLASLLQRGDGEIAAAALDAERSASAVSIFDAVVAAEGVRLRVVPSTFPGQVPCALLDVAMLELEIAACAGDSCAEAFVERYFELTGGRSESAAYRFFRGATLAIQAVPDNASPPDQTLLRRSFATCVIPGYAPLIVLDCRDAETAMACIDAIAGLVPASVLPGAEPARNATFGDELVRRTAFERLDSDVRQALLDRDTVVARWPLHRAEDRIRLRQIAESSGRRVVAVVVRSPGEPSAAGDTMPWELATAKDIPDAFFVDTLLPFPELAARVIEAGRRPGRQRARYVAAT